VGVKLELFDVVEHVSYLFVWEHWHLCHELFQHNEELLLLVGFNDVSYDIL